MLQMQLPIFPDGTTQINNVLGFKKEEGKIVYLNGMMPVFCHDEDDLRSFRMITSQFCDTGTTKQVEICRAFGVTPISVKRGVKLYRTEGVEGFFRPRKPRGPTILTKEVLSQAQALLIEGQSVPEVAVELDIKPDTLSKAVRDGRLQKPQQNEPIEKTESTSNKSERSHNDSQALMGMGATNTLARVAASMGELEGDGVLPNFTPNLDVTNGGVLFALPALLATGLLRHTRDLFQLPSGYYTLESIFMLLALLALARIKSLEKLRFCAPGEWGKLLGLDRIPEVRTLRKKIHLLSAEEAPTQLGSRLCKDWMNEVPEQSGVFYIDGHVRVYNGIQTKLPRHYVARQKLCLRATTDYWVNAMDGQPFMVLNKAVDPGLIKVLEGEIVPRMEENLPPPLNDVLSEASNGLPGKHRFTVIFDREGYSPNAMKRLKKRHVAVINYHKHPGEPWPEEEFFKQEVTLQNGEVVTMELAERGSCLSNKLWVREFRRRTQSGHQTAILSTDYHSHHAIQAIAMFSRWSQENFFKYMRENFSLDRLVDYRVEAISDPVQVVNPAHRRLDGQVRSLVGKLTRRQAKFGAMSLEGDIEPNKVDRFERKKAALQEEVEQLQGEVDQLKAQRKQTQKHIDLSELPESERFDKLSTQSKYLIDTIKMIAYRAETAMANLLKGPMSHKDSARSLLKAIYESEADILPDEEQGTLTIRLHHLANWSSAKAVQVLCEELNETETLYPGTKLCMIFKMGAS
jgi:uncharacterized protein YlxW (UPF0749 family)